MDPAADRSPALTRRRAHWALVALAVAALLLVRLALLEPFRIPSDSMSPTILRGDQVLVDKRAYHGRAPHRGDLAVFHAPRTGEILLKRIVAVGGDTVGIEDGVLVVDGRRPREPYADPEAIDSVYFGPVRVARGSVFVLGDNRANAEDSRDFGAVRAGRLIGRVRARIWPPVRWGTPR